MAGSVSPSTGPASPSLLLRPNRGKGREDKVEALGLVVLLDVVPLAVGRDERPSTGGSYILQLPTPLRSMLWAICCLVAQLMTVETLTSKSVGPEVG